MTAYVPTEGNVIIGDQVFKNVTTDRGTNLYLGLFTNSSVSGSTTMSAITQPTGTGYAEFVLTDASWTDTSGVLTYAPQTFTAGAGGWTGSVYGYYIRTNGTTHRLLCLETDGSGPFTFASGDTYAITPSITIA